MAIINKKYNLQHFHKIIAEIMHTSFKKTGSDVLLPLGNKIMHVYSDGTLVCMLIFATYTKSSIVLEVIIKIECYLSTLALFSI